MKILMIGDIVGSPGRKIFKREIPRIKREMGVNAVIANAENCAAGSGITAALAKELFEAGADAITLGDHTWGQKEFAGQIDSVDKLVRPLNFPSECPGKGWRIVTMPTFRFAVINALGRVFMTPSDCPFKAIDRALQEIPKDIPVFVDFHAEATAEKIALGQYLKDDVTCVYGTHTHVQTADERILPNKTAYISDVGMCGSIDSVIGYDYKSFIDRKKKNPSTFVAKNAPYMINALYVEIDLDTKEAIHIERINEKM